jgi:hypothetical protein
VLYFYIALIIFRCRILYRCPFFLLHFFVNQEKYYELSYYTLAHGEENFIHQHIADAYTVQTADEHTKPVALLFTLAGLYLFAEKNFSGRQIQGIHQQMAEKYIKGTRISLPAKRGDVIITDVLNAAPGTERDNMIRNKPCNILFNIIK